MADNLLNVKIFHHRGVSENGTPLVFRALILCVLAATLLGGCAQPPVRLASYNIQYDAVGDSVAAWAVRRDIVRNLLDSCGFDIFGSQEPMTYQVEDIVEMCPQYAWIGESTDSVADPSKRHHNPVFYRRDRFTVLVCGAFWYADTPERRYSRGWDSGYIRMCNWVKFRDRRSGKVFFVFNSHFDHIGREAPLRSAEMLPSRVRAIAGNAPAFCLGDYNVDQHSEVYRIIVDSGVLEDSYVRAPERTGDGYPSYTAYRHITEAVEDARRIDCIFVTAPVRVLRWTLVRYHEEGRYGSDHLPVCIDAVW